MHATIVGKDLTRALKAVKTVIDKYTTIPIMQHVRMKIDGAALQIEATNLDMWMRAKIDVVEASDDFDVTVPAALLFAAVKAAGPAIVRIDYIETKSPPRSSNPELGEVINRHVKIIIGDGDQEFTVESLDPTDWPEAKQMLDLTGPKPFETFTNGQFTKLLATASVAISTEETRYYLNGVYWEAGSFTATDGHRLVSVKYSSDLGAQNKAIIPRRAVNVLLSFVGNADVKAEFWKQGDNEARHLMFSWGDYTLLTKTIDGTFPDYRRVIPKRDPENTVFEFDGARLSEAVEIAKSFLSAAGKGRHAVALMQIDGEISLGKLELRGEIAFKVKTFSKWPTTTIEKIGLNVHYLQQAIPKMGTVRITTQDAGAPMLIDIDGEEDVTRVLMPMRV